VSSCFRYTKSLKKSILLGFFIAEVAERECGEAVEKPEARVPFQCKEAIRGEEELEETNGKQVAANNEEKDRKEAAFQVRFALFFDGGCGGLRGRRWAAS
jgi:hypothetical protein